MSANPTLCHSYLAIYEPERPETDALTAVQPTRDHLLIRWVCRHCGSDDIRARGRVWAYEALDYDGRHAEFTTRGEDYEYAPHSFEADDYCCFECGRHENLLSDLTGPYVLAIGDRVYCPDGYEGLIEGAALTIAGGHAVAVVGDRGYWPQDLYPATPTGAGLVRSSGFWAPQPVTDKPPTLWDLHGQQT